MEEDEEITIQVKQPCTVCDGRGRIPMNVGPDIHCTACEGTGLVNRRVLLSVHLGALEETIAALTSEIAALHEMYQEGDNWAVGVNTRLKRVDERLRGIEDRLDSADY